MGKLGHTLERTLGRLPPPRLEINRKKRLKIHFHTLSSSTASAKGNFPAAQHFRGTGNG